MTYARKIEPTGPVEFLNDDRWATLQFEKKASWKPLVIDTQPVSTQTQVLVDTGIVFEEKQARQTWALREMTQSEIDRSELDMEKQQITNYLVGLNTQLKITNANRAALTNNQRINELEKDTRILMKAVKYLLRNPR